MIEGRENLPYGYKVCQVAEKELKKERVEKPRKKPIQGKKSRSEDTEVQIYRVSILETHSMSSSWSLGDLFA
jgi:hypothetical protein